MMLLTYLLLGSLLVGSTVSEVTTTNIDFAGTYQGDLSNLMTRVQKLVDVKYNYVTSSTNEHTQFPDMIIEFDLEFSQYVEIGYHISTILSGISHFITRLVIDGSENPLFRFISSNVLHPTNWIVRSIWMQKGHHQAFVQYRTNRGTSIVPRDRCNYCAADFMVRYFKK